MICIAFLRGINVGGHTTVPMAELKKCFEALDFKNVRTYINSGNVIFEALLAEPRKLEAQIEQALEAHFNIPLTVVVRTLPEMEALIAALPKSWLTPEDKRYNVIFLTHRIDSADILKNFVPKPAIEEVHYRPGALLWSANTSDLTKTAMLKINKMALYKDMTIRGLNTTRKVLEIMRSLQS